MLHPRMQPSRASLILNKASFPLPANIDDGPSAAQRADHAGFEPSRTRGCTVSRRTLQTTSASLPSLPLPLTPYGVLEYAPQNKQARPLCSERAHPIRRSFSTCRHVAIMGSLTRAASRSSRKPTTAHGQAGKLSNDVLLSFSVCLRVRVSLTPSTASLIIPVVSFQVRRQLSPPGDPADESSPAQPAGRFTGKGTAIGILPFRTCMVCQLVGPCRWRPRQQNNKSSRKTNPNTMQRHRL